MLNSSQTLLNRERSLTLDTGVFSWWFLAEQLRAVLLLWIALCTNWVWSICEGTGLAFDEQLAETGELDNEEAMITSDGCTVFTEDVYCSGRVNWGQTELSATPKWNKCTAKHTTITHNRWSVAYLSRWVKLP